jgi:TrmH family RNA methyltransferase
MPTPASPAVRGVIGPRHPSVKRLRRLSRRRSARTDEGLFVVDGPVLLAEALDAGVALEEVIAEPEAPPSLLERAAAAGATVHRAADGALAAATDTTTPQGVAAIASLRDAAASVADAVAAAGPLALVLVGVADPGNAGTLLRSAEAAGAGAVLFCAGSVDPYGPKCVRASAGSLFRLAIGRDGDTGAALAALRAHGLTTVATLARGAPAYDAADLGGPVALVLGNEAHGLPPGVAAAVDEAVTIPMAGRADSLNVAMAGTILCFEALRQRRAGATAHQQGDGLPLDRHLPNRDAPRTGVDR